MTENIGKVVQIIGPVLDIRFDTGKLPDLLNAIEIENEGKTIVCEVAQQLGEDRAVDRDRILIRRIHFPFALGYGMTECGPIITYVKWDKTRLYSCGKPAPHISVKIDSPDPRNVPGEILVKGENTFLGYYKNPQATADALTDDGWLRTGDMGIIDEDGFLFLKGRSKCMILGPSGQNIYPEEIEAQINNVQYVVDSLVIEDEGGLKALIYPDYPQGALDKLSKADVEARIRQAIPEINKEQPNYSRIKAVEFMPEDFERTPKRSIKRYLYQRSK